MLSFLRRLINSRAGVAITLGFLVLVAVLFGLGDVVAGWTSGSASGDAVARVAGHDISAAELSRAANNSFGRAQSEQPTLTLPAFVAQGGVEATLERMIGDLALEHFGGDAGMVVSRRAEDGQIASLPQLQDAAGQFSQANYESLLKQAGLSDAQFRTSVRQNVMARMLVAPLGGNQPVATQFSAAYAGMLLEKRDGTVAVIPAEAAVAGPAPTDAELATFYGRQKARYTVPERRVVRYALATPDLVRARATPTDAELAAAFDARRAEFAATEKRSVVAVTVLDQKSAADLAAKAKGGAELAAAARAAGLEPRTLAGLTRAQMTEQAGPALADAAFAAAQGAALGPVRASGGFVVAKLTAVEKVAGKSLAEVRPQLTQAVTATKTQALLNGLRAKLDDALGAKKTFAEAVAAMGLTPAITPALTAQAIDPDHPEAKPDPRLVPVVAAAFQAEPGDPPALAPAGQDGSFALLSLDRVVAPTPPPLDKIRALVTRDFVRDRAGRAARTAAAAILARVNAGTPLAQALAASGLKLPPPQPIGAARGALTAGGRKVPPALAFLFSMAPGTTRVLDLPNGGGSYLIRLDKVTPGDAHHDQALLARVGGEFRQIVGREQGDQFVRAVEAEAKVTRNVAALARVKADLSGQSGQGGQAD